jgi:hypothetical protein
MGWFKQDGVKPQAAPVIQEADRDGWVGHGGNGCPVDTLAVVETQTKDGLYQDTATALNVDWSSVKRYRLVRDGLGGGWIKWHGAEKGTPLHRDVLVEVYPHNPRMWITKDRRVLFGFVSSFDWREDKPLLSTSKPLVRMYRLPSEETLSRWKKPTMPLLKGLLDSGHDSVMAITRSQCSGRSFLLPGDDGKFNFFLTERGSLVWLPENFHYTERHTETYDPYVVGWK